MDSTIQVYSAPDLKLLKKQEISTLVESVDTSIEIIDTKSYDLVHSDQMKARDLRLSIEKARTEFTADLTAKQKEAIAIERELTAPLIALEDTLKAKKKEYDDAKEAKKQEEARAKQARINGRLQLLAQYNGGPQDIFKLSDMSDDEFNTLLTRTKEAFEWDESERKRIEEEAKVENDRIRKEQEEAQAKLKEEQDKLRKEQEEAQAKLKEEQDKLRKEQEEAQAKLKEEQDALRAKQEAFNAEKRKLQEEKDAIARKQQQEADLETARINAEEKAKRDLEASIALEKQKKIDADNALALKKKYQDFLLSIEYDEKTFTHIDLPNNGGRAFYKLVGTFKK